MRLREADRKKMRVTTRERHLNLLADRGYTIDEANHLAWVDCRRCGGSGRFSFNPLDGDRCFGCLGAKGDWVDASRVARNVLARESRERRKDVTARRRVLRAIEDARRVLASDPDLRAAFAGSRNHFIRRVAAQLVRRGSVTPAQRTAVIRAAARESVTERAAEVVSVPVPEALLAGRHEVEGRIVHTRWVYSQWGSTLKGLIIVAADGGEFKLWGSIPADLISEDLDQARITFTARFERSHDDAAFGFFNRPTKATIQENRQ